MGTAFKINYTVQGIYRVRFSRLLVLTLARISLDLGFCWLVLRKVGTFVAVGVLFAGVEF